MVEYRRSKLQPAEQRAYDELVQALKARKKNLACHGVNTAQALRICTSIFYDHPEIFYMGHSFRAVEISRGTVAVYQNYVYSEDEIRSCEETLKRAVNILRLRMRSDMTEKDKIITVAEYVVRNCDYEIDYEKNQNAAAAICYHRAQCSGYSRAISYLLDKLGIWSILVDGQGYDGLGGGGSHAWNIVRMGEHYYHLDVTFMEAYNLGRVKNAALTYLFYDDKLIAKDHEWDKTFFPACTDPTMAIKSNRVARETDPVHDAGPRGGRGSEYSLTEGDGTLQTYRKGMNRNTSSKGRGGALASAEPPRYGSEAEIKNAIQEAMRNRAASLEFCLDLRKLNVLNPEATIRKCINDAWASLSMKMGVRAQTTLTNSDQVQINLIYI